MGERELREKYGGKLAKAINRAVRAEIPGGNEALDLLTKLAGPAMHSGWKDGEGNNTPEASAYHKHKRQVVEKMEATIRARWKIPQEIDEPKRPVRRQRSSVGQSKSRGAVSRRPNARGSGSRPKR